MTTLLECFPAGVKWRREELGQVCIVTSVTTVKETKKIRRAGVLKFWFGDRATKYASRTRRPLA